MLVQSCNLSTHFPLTSKLLGLLLVGGHMAVAISSEAKNFWGQNKASGNCILRRKEDLFPKVLPELLTPLKTIWYLKGKRGFFTCLTSWWTTELNKVSLGIIAVLQMRKLELRGFKEFIKSLHNPSWGVGFEPRSPILQTHALFNHSRQYSYF